MRYVVDYGDYKTKTLKKPQTLLVRGFANRNKQLEYDTYVVEFKGVLYFLPSEGVEDNSLIESVNASLGAENTLYSYTATTKSSIRVISLYNTNTYYIYIYSLAL